MFKKKDEAVTDFYEQCFADFQRRTHESIKNLAKENQELKEETERQDNLNKQLVKECQTFEERINKAIGYINNQSPDAGVSGKRIKEILKGGSNG